MVPEQDSEKRILFWGEWLVKVAYIRAEVWANRWGTHSELTLTIQKPGLPAEVRRYACERRRRVLELATACVLLEHGAPASSLRHLRLSSSEANDDTGLSALVGRLAGLHAGAPSVCTDILVPEARCIFAAVWYTSPLPNSPCPLQHHPIQVLSFVPTLPSHRKSGKGFRLQGILPVYSDLNRSQIAPPAPYLSLEAEPGDSVIGLALVGQGLALYRAGELVEDYGHYLGLRGKHARLYRIALEGQQVVTDLAWASKTCWGLKPRLSDLMTIQRELALHMQGTLSKTEAHQFAHTFTQAVRNRYP